MVVRPFPGWRGVPALSPDPEGGRQGERIPVRGQRPVSLKTMEGADAVFMDSYHQAMAAHDLLREELRSNKTVEELNQRLVKVRTGAKKDFVTIASVPERWAKFHRENPISDAHKANGLAVLNRFVGFMGRRWPGCKDLIDVRVKPGGGLSRSRIGPGHLRPNLERVAGPLEVGVFQARTVGGRLHPVSAQRQIPQRRHGAPRTLYRR